MNRAAGLAVGCSPHEGRWQLLRVKAELSQLDKTFLEIASPIGKNFVNIESVTLHDWPNISNIREGQR